MGGPVFKTLVDIIEMLRKKKIRFTVIGGLAVSWRGEPRATGDVDIVVDIDVIQAVALKNELNQTPFCPLFPGVAEVIKSSLILPLIHKDTKVTVDLSLGLSGFEKQLIMRATDIELEGHFIPVATAEDLILMKLCAGRQRDMDDISRLVKLRGKDLDWEYLIKIGRELQRALAQDIIPELEKFKYFIDP
ncbi:hypothetical protein ES703_50809 [subsurface metagenome]